MKKINAIDLDKTLIPFDSFRALIVSYLKRKSFLTPVTYYTVLRKMRVIKSGEFKHRSLKIIRQDGHYQNMIQDLAGRIMSAVRPDIIKIINCETDLETINVLISASPANYVRLVAKGLGWPYLASEIIDGEFVNCYGQKKIELLGKHYPKNKFVYNFAISDSQSDMPLLEMFTNHMIVSK